MDLSFSIVNFKSDKLLIECIRTLVASLSNSYQYEITVVDNGSTDHAISEVQTEFPRVHWIQNSENLGYTKAMNQGLKASKGRYVVQINPDVIVHEETFQQLVQFMDMNIDVGISTPRVLNRDGTLQKQCHRSFARPWDVISYFLYLDRLFPHSPFFGRYLMTYLPEDEIADVESVSGSCMVVRRVLFEQIGFLDEQFYAYQEDSDFCFRAHNMGWRVVYYPKASITHFGGMGGSLEQPFKAIFAWHKSYFLYYRKHLAKDYFFLVNWFMYLAMVMKLVFAYIRFIFSRRKAIGTYKP